MYMNTLLQYDSCINSCDHVLSSISADTPNMDIMQS